MKATIKVNVTFDIVVTGLSQENDPIVEEDL